MEESSLFDYWFAILFILFFVVWFPSYIIKTKGKGDPPWLLCISIVAVFLLLPITATSFFKDIAPAFFLSHNSEMWEAPNAVLAARTARGATTLNHVYIVMAALFVVVGIGQAFFSAWLLYVRHNRESLLRAIRLMWCSGLMQVLAVGILPFLILHKRGFDIAVGAAPALGFYLLVLGLVTIYFRISPDIPKFYPVSHRKDKDQNQK